MSIKFGTDGWRALIAEEFTFENVRICAQGTADFLNQSRLASKGLYIGYDTRFESESFLSTGTINDDVGGSIANIIQCHVPTL